jgi:hypothetical protein
MAAIKCEFSGCKCEAHWIAIKLWGKGGSLKVCDEHKPDPDKRPESQQKLPFFYDVQPLRRDK